jgi:plasmid rolling circle replication initiator protein Rep
MKNEPLTQEMAEEMHPADLADLASSLYEKWILDKSKDLKQQFNIASSTANKKYGREMFIKI